MPTAALQDVIHNPQRLRAVRSSGLADSPPEECFDGLTRLAAETVGAAAAFLSVIDERGDFYKSIFGFADPLASSRRLTGETFCHHALVNEGMLVIDDARRNPDYQHVPTIRSLGVIAYVGVPIESPDGHALGAFCVIDTKPRAWSSREIETILLLARATMREIEARFRGQPPESGAVGKSVHLSKREREVMLRILAGQRSKDIALQMNVSVKTVSTHRVRLLKKLGLSSERDLFRYALENGLMQGG